ncbi:hypothetical protein ACFV7Q_38395, partial [Streptomyces sp. NPDC059851]|uniref:hypothetical protein n=1 Tax=Streptomyces sp. NPDC059851 TaxID=3346971 RepID=UPI003662DB0F
MRAGTPRPDAGRQQLRDLLAPPQPDADFDQGSGEVPVRKMRQEQRVRLLTPPLPGQQPGQVVQGAPLPVHGERADQVDGFAAAAARIQQPGGLPRRRPPPGAHVRGEHRESTVQFAAACEAARPGALRRTSRRPPPWPGRAHVGAAEREEAVDEHRRHALLVHAGPAVEYGGIHVRTPTARVAGAAGRVRAAAVGIPRARGRRSERRGRGLAGVRPAPGRGGGRGAVKPGCRADPVRQPGV